MMVAIHFRPENTAYSKAVLLTAEHMPMQLLVETLRQWPAVEAPGIWYASTLYQP